MDRLGLGLLEVLLEVPLEVSPGLELPGVVSLVLGSAGNNPVDKGERGLASFAKRPAIKAEGGLATR